MGDQVPQTGKSRSVSKAKFSHEPNFAMERELPCKKTGQLTGIGQEAADVRSGSPAIATVA
jgi:hypothetical protein